MVKETIRLGRLYHYRLPGKRLWVLTRDVKAFNLLS